MSITLDDVKTELARAIRSKANLYLPHTAGCDVEVEFIENRREKKDAADAPPWSWNHEAGEIRIRFVQRAPDGEAGEDEDAARFPSLREMHKFEPFEIEGEPLSETVIKARR